MNIDLAIKLIYPLIEKSAYTIVLDANGEETIGEWKNILYKKPTREELVNVLDTSNPEYVERIRNVRAAEYPRPQQQLEILCEEGLEALKQRIQAVKTKYPKANL